jgi:hypothetical protein
MQPRWLYDFDPSANPDSTATIELTGAELAAMPAPLYKQVALPDVLASAIAVLVTGVRDAGSGATTIESTMAIRAALRTS